MIKNIILCTKFIFNKAYFKEERNNIIISYNFNMTCFELEKGKLIK